MNKELSEAIGTLAEIIKRSEEAAKLNEAVEDYQRDEELSSLVAEYNLQQQFYADSFSDDEETKEKIEKRMNELYESILANTSYLNYTKCKGAYDSYYNEILSELNFRVTGTKPCSHDCSTCGGCSG